jgi:hypothetical protein
MARIRLRELHPQHLAAMRLVRDGADVFAYDTARLLREVYERRPDCIEISQRPFGTYPEGSQRPIFGAILTPHGIELLGEEPATDAEVTA